MVFLVEMPVYKAYYEALNSDKKEKIVTTLAKLQSENEDVIYIKLSQDPRFNSDDLRDADHLTNEGAKKCSQLLNKIIMEKIQWD